MAREYISGELYHQEIVLTLKEWVNSSTLRDSIIEEAIGELGSILRLTESEEDFILEIEGV